MTTLHCLQKDFAEMFFGQIRTVFISTRQALLAGQRTEIRYKYSAAGWYSNTHLTNAVIITEEKTNFLKKSLKKLLSGNLSFCGSPLLRHTE